MNPNSFTKLSLVALLFLGQPALAGVVRGKVSARGPAPSQLIVFVEKAPAGTAKAQTVKNSQRNLKFSPAVMVIRKGEKIEFKNEDKVYHNVFSLTPGNEFDLGLYRGGDARSQTFDGVGEVDVFCNIHPDMVAKVLVLQNELHASAGKDGSYTLAGVPSGTFTVVAWSPEHKPQKKQVTVGEDGAPVTLDFELAPRAASKPHLNKNDEQYGRYK